LDSWSGLEQMGTKITKGYEPWNPIRYPSILQVPWHFAPSCSLFVMMICCTRLLRMEGSNC
jgi:hypothetical protein